VKESRERGERRLSRNSTEERQRQCEKIRGEMQAEILPERK